MLSTDEADVSDDSEFLRVLRGEHTQTQTTHYLSSFRALVVGARNLLVIQELLSTDEADVPDDSEILRALCVLCGETFPPYTVQAMTPPILTAMVNNTILGYSIKNKEPDHAPVRIPL